MALRITLTLRQNTLASALLLCRDNGLPVVWITKYLNCTYGKYYHGNRRSLKLLEGRRPTMIGIYLLLIRERDFPIAKLLLPDICEGWGTWMA